MSVYRNASLRVLPTGITGAISEKSGSEFLLSQLRLPLRGKTLSFFVATIPAFVSSRIGIFVAFWLPRGRLPWCEASVTDETIFSFSIFRLRSVVVPITSTWTGIVHDMRADEAFWGALPSRPTF